MKKLLSFFAAGLLAVGSLGVMSCSGDLQDNDVQPLTITGIAGTQVVPMTIPTGGDGSEQYFTFKVAEDSTFTGMDGKQKALKDGWGGLSAIQFKIVPSTELAANTEPNWKVDWGGATDAGNLFIKPGEDYTPLLMRGDKGTTAAGPSNVQIDGAIMNETYTIRVKYNANSVSLKIEGVSSDPSAMNLNIVGDSKNFPAKDKDGNDLFYAMEKAGSAYTYDFISVADEIVEFYITNSLAGTFGGNLESGELELNASKTTNLKFSAEKNIEYKLTVDISKGINNATIKGEVISMLNKATLNANWKYADNFYEVSAKDGSYQFIAENTELSLTVNRAEGDKTLAWGSSSAVTVDGDAVELAYTEKADAKPVAVKGLKADTCYKIILEADDDNFSLRASVIEVPLVNLSEPMLGINGDFNSWGHTDFIIKDGVGTAEFTATATEHQIQIAADGWNPQYGNGKAITVDGDELTGISGKNNMIIKGCVVGTTYQVICKPNYGAVDVKIITKK